MAGRISYLGGIVKDGLILDLDAGKLDSYNRVGTTWNDLSGNGNNGTLTNFGSQTIWNGDNGGSIIFDGTNDYVDLGSTINNLFSINLPITIELVVYMNISGNDESFIGNSWDDPGVLIRKTSTNFIRSIFLQNGSTYRAKDSPILTSGWYHIVSTYNGNNINTLSNYSLYINSSTTGVTNLSNNTITSITPVNNLNLGRSSDPTNFAYLNGKISVVRIYNKALSSTEVLQNYNALKGRYNL
jgi:hypothetical protein